MYKAVVFDLDGTLVNSPLCFDSIREELEIPQSEYILEYLDQLPHVDRIPKLKRLEEIEIEAAQQAVAIPGVHQVLQRLSDLKIRLGLLTRNCRAATSHILKLNSWNFHLALTREDAPAKPDPAGLLQILSQWNLNPQELLFIGDYRFDIECGKNAGVRTALFTNGQAPEADWGPDFIFQDYSEFFEVLWVSPT